MSTSPGGDPYGSQHQPPLNPYTFPSAPAPEPEPQYRQPRIQPYAPPQGPRHGGGSGGGHGGGGSYGNGGGSGGAGKRPPTPTGLVRPYAMTGGRTRPRYQLAIEALVSTTADPERLRGQLPEHQRICLLCREIKSIAEISALLTIPLGVVRILVADLAEAGLVQIHQPGGDESSGGQPAVTLLERVLSGLRKL
ncbi:DUF742 domain-containing protein [Streptomyces sp. CBMA29]|uniref:DUF742 domain-containing protein n=1 Tax=Streptomyces sp. CBMA29 TaxID=1896314 RepID=UPI001661B888|nr:DUF742 domain-containing protein [Streptomyces sp. CBMA29]MBD0739504.1 hypothetical protein [Streptomyces sp. CBMA29]